MVGKQSLVVELGVLNIQCEAAHILYVIFVVIVSSYFS